jgi:hypothetical protein
MVRLFPALALVLALGAVAACSDDDATAPEPQARLRVLHASPDAPNVDVLVDNQIVLTNVPFRTASSYLSVDAGARNLKVRVTGTNTTVIDVTPTLAASTDYTVIARGLVANIGALLLTDNNTAPTAGNVKVRLVHGAPGAGNVDIYVTAPNADLNTTTPTLSSIPFLAVSDYLSVPAGNYQIRITPAGTKTVAINTGTLTLTAGQIRTGVAVDAVGGGSPFAAVLLADRN